MTLTIAEAEEQVTGVWKLLSYDLILDSGSGSQKMIQPAGPTPLGRAIMTSDGFMSGTVTNPLTKRTSSATPWATALDKEIADVAKHVMHYMGHFRIFVEDGDLRVATKVHVALDPSWVGTEQVRKLELKEEDGKRIMTLRPVHPFLTPDGSEGEAVLVWEKMLSSDFS